MASVIASEAIVASRFFRLVILLLVVDLKLENPILRSKHRSQVFKILSVRNKTFDSLI